MRKDNVMRLTNKEKKVIELLRSEGDNLVEGLETCFVNYYKDLKSDNLPIEVESVKSLMSLLMKGGIKNIEQMIQFNVITQDEVDLINESIAERKNIIFTGEMGSGKTSVLSSILNNQKNKSFILYESGDEIDLTEEMLRDNNVSYVDISTQAFQDALRENINNKDVIFVITDVSSPTGIANLFLILDAGHQVIAIANGSGNWLMEISLKMDSIQGLTTSKRFDKMIKEAMYEAEFVEIHVEKFKDSSNVTHRRVTKISQHNKDKTISALRERGQYISVDEFRLEGLIESGFISESDADFLIKSISNKENIIITGGSGVGKTVLLKALLNKQVEKNIVLCENYKELYLNEEAVKNNTLYKIDANLSSEVGNAIGNNKDNKNTIFVLDEIVSPMSITNLLLVLEAGYPAISTTHGNADWIREMSNRLDTSPSFSKDGELGELGKYTMRVIQNSEFIEVHIKTYRESNKATERKVSSIVKHHKGTKISILRNGTTWEDIHPNQLKNLKD